MSYSNSIKRFFSGTFLSRMSGMVRDLSMAFAFGDHPSIAAFMVAFRLSNLLRRLLGEGPFQSAFIPYYEGIRAENNQKSLHFFRKLTLYFILILLSFVLLTEGLLSGMLYSGAISPNFQEVLHLMRYLMPAALFISLYGLNISLMHCHDQFFMASAAPMLCNIIWALSVWLLRSLDPSLAMISLAKWVVIGFIAQWALTLPFVIRHLKGSWREWLDLKISPEIRGLSKALFLGVIGIGAMQINTFFDALFARYADVSGPTYLWYAIRLEQFVLALFAIACVSTLTPRLSRAIKQNFQPEAQLIFQRSMTYISALMIPCTFALFLLSPSATNLLFGHGQFSEPAVLRTALCLIAYGFGLFASAGTLLYSTIFYAQKNFRVPMWIALSSVAMNLILNGLFVFTLKLGPISIALATSLSGWIQLVILRTLTSRQGWAAKTDRRQISALLTSGFIALLLSLSLDHFLFGGLWQKMFAQQTETYPRILTQQLAYLGVLGLSFLLIYSAMLWLLRGTQTHLIYRSIMSGDSTRDRPDPT